MKKILEWIKPILIAIVIALVINNFIIINVIIPTSSMENTIQVKDRGVAFRLSYLFSDPERGDIVVFDANYKDVLLVKRVIGLPGDVVEIKDGEVLVNHEVLDEPYVKEAMLGEFGPYEVPSGQYFMLGDNRNNSKDSRDWDNPYIERSLIRGKFLFKYFPSIEVLGG